MARTTWSQMLESWSYRCTVKACRARWDASNHPFFYMTTKGSIPLAQQTWIMSNFLNKVPAVATHMQIGVSHQTVERLNDRLRLHIAEYVRMQQDKIIFNDSDAIAEIEADEVTICRRASGDEKKPVVWTQYLGIMRRGHPHTLVLVKMPDRCTPKRAPGPGPLQVKVWQEISSKYLGGGQQLILHTDAARAYNRPLPNITHTSVVHQVKFINGEWKNRHTFAPRT